VTPVNLADLLPPEDDRPAPGRLVLVQALVNTLDRESGADALGSPAAAATWLARAGCAGRVNGAGLARLVAVREALRELLAANAELPGASARRAAAALAGAGVRLAADLGPTGEVRIHGVGAGVDRLVGEAVAAMQEAQIAGTWPRLKACADPACRWAFYDASRNRAGAWCSMAECGNRSKVRRFRERAARRTEDGAVRARRAGAPRARPQR